MADKLVRFASGEIKGFNFTRPNKSGGYGFGFEGFFEDTKDRLESYLGSKYPIKIFESDNDPINPEEAQNLRFKGRVMIEQTEWEGKTYYWPKAVSIEQRIETMEYNGGGSDDVTTNPFLDNPTMA